MGFAQPARPPAVPSWLDNEDEILVWWQALGKARGRGLSMSKAETAANKAVRAMRKQADKGDTKGAD